MIDGITLKKEVKYLQQNLIGNRIDKVYHPAEKLVVLKLKDSVAENNKLMISVNPDFCSLHLSKESHTNPDQPSTFCMSLRKHLEGGRIVELEQKGYERLIDLRIENYNKIGLKSIKILHLELMGKYSNIILSENNIIIDALYKYPIGINGFREILPKRTYFSPPISEKLDLDQLILKRLNDFLTEDDVSPDTSLVIWLQKFFQGFSKKSIVNLLEGQELAAKTVADLNQENIARIFSLLKTASVENYIPDSSLNERINNAFFEYINGKYTQDTYNRLNNLVEKQIKKLIKKKFIYEDKILQGNNADEFRIKGELLSSNLYRLKENIAEAEVENYYDEENKLIKIILNLKYSPSQNAKRYFKKYVKIKEGSKQGFKLLQEVISELEYFESIKNSLGQVKNIDEFEEIKEELVSLNFIKTNKRKKKVNKKPSFKTYTLNNGDVIFIGSNNKQNDYLTFKFAFNGDLWFHVKNAPGAHVILRKENNSTDFSPESILEAAKETAKASGISGAKVEVDYTLKKYVKRHPSHNLGHGVYTNQQTIIVYL